MSPLPPPAHEQLHKGEITRPLFPPCVMDFERKRRGLGEGNSLSCWTDESKGNKSKKRHITMSLHTSSGEQGRTADLRVMNPVL